MSKPNSSRANNRKSINSGPNSSRPNATWITYGKLVKRAEPTADAQPKAASILHIYSLENIGSDRLLDNLLALRGHSAALPGADNSPNNSNPNDLNPNNSNPKNSNPKNSNPQSSHSSDWLIGLDFPFSFPRPFAEILMGADPSCTWVDLAKLVSNLSFEELLDQVKAAKPIMGGEVKRLTDNSTDPKAQSPLHQINPGMLKMTWQGMQLLLGLHKQGLAILPFTTSDSTSGLCMNGQLTKGANCFRARAMEVYPAAVLKSLGLPWRKYKGKDPEAEQLRQFILNNLTGKGDKLRSVNRITIAIPELALPPHLEQLALACDDALDAVIAALGAAIAYLNPGQTAPPRQISADLIALEGWIYVTYPQTTEATS
jgi:hypothetical protein